MTSGAAIATRGFAFSIDGLLAGDRLGHSDYRELAFRHIFKAVIRADRLTIGDARLSAGDTKSTLEGKDRTHVIAITAKEGEQALNLIEGQLKRSGAPGFIKVLSAKEVAAEPLTRIIEFDHGTRVSWSEGPWIVSAWRETVEAMGYKVAEDLNLPY